MGTCFRINIAELSTGCAAEICQQKHRVMKVKRFLNTGNKALIKGIKRVD